MPLNIGLLQKSMLPLDMYMKNWTTCPSTTKKINSALTVSQYVSLVAVVDCCMTRYNKDSEYECQVRNIYGSDESEVFFWGGGVSVVEVC